MRSAAGRMVVTVYGDEAGKFLAPHGKLLRERAPAAAPTTRVCFRVPGPGVYAVAVYHDEDGDGHFNRDWRGLPSEGFGFSNDAPTPIGLPAFKAVRIAVKADGAPLRIHLRYLSPAKSR